MCGIFDECHYIKSPKTVRSKASIRLSAAIPRSFMLTGTPIINRPHELWPTLHIIDDGKWPNSYAFQQRYCKFGGFEGRQIVGVKNARELNDKIKPILVRRKKKDVVDLPPKIRSRVVVEMHPTQAKLYKEAKEQMRLTLPGESASPMEMGSALVTAGRLRQIACTPYCVRDEKGNPLFEDNSTKLDVVVQSALEAIDNDDRPLIFSDYRGVLDALAQRFAKAGVHAAQLHGGIKTADRVAHVDAWGERLPEPLLCITKVAGQGLNMAEYSSTAIFATRNWAPAWNEQAENRIHRIGSGMTSSVNIITVTSLDTIEERVEEVLADKQKISSQIIDGEFDVDDIDNTTDVDLRQKLYDLLLEELNDDR